jgi:IMP dehydrogenase
MDTVTEYTMMAAMATLGGIGILHRFMSIEDTGRNIRKFRSNFPEDPLAVSIGVNGDTDARIALFKELGIDITCIDIAHGDNDRVIDLIGSLKDVGRWDVIAGNIATPEAAERLCIAGVDAIKVGIGPGSMCTTRLMTGFGVPQLSAIIECAQIADQYNVPIIADGGIRTSGDIVKSLAAGADSVMVGSLLAGTQETPGEVRTIGGNKFKEYRGMASKDAMVSWRGEVPDGIAAEGESTLRSFIGPVSTVVQELLGGIRSGLSYNGSLNIVCLQTSAVFRFVSPNTIIENKPHGK